MCIMVKALYQLGAAAPKGMKRRKLICLLTSSLAVYVFVLCLGVYGYCYFRNVCLSNGSIRQDSTTTTMGIGVSTSIMQWVPECHCFRQFAYRGPSEGMERYDSTCSDEGTFYHKRQKVVSFSLYFFPKDKRNSTLKSIASYKIGIMLNLKAMRKHYSGYTMRIYTDRDPVQLGYCDLLCINPDLMWCNIKKSPALGDQSGLYFTIWRVLPLGDDTVDHFLSRDLDSVLTEREAAVVHDWLQLPEKKAIHLMRDKNHGHNTEILGGMWGARNAYFQRAFNGTIISAKEARTLILENSQVTDFSKIRDTGFDQTILRTQLYDGLKHQIVAYDSYTCLEYSETMVRPFPTKRKNSKTDFVGNTDFGRTDGKLKKCPEDCRPSYGKNWEYC